METLESAFTAARPYIPYVIEGGAVLVVGVLAYKTLKFTSKSGPGSIKAPPNTAVIYQYNRGPYSPSLSPFPIKLETYCRLNKIPYLADCTGRASSKGKVPWMTYNEDVVEDSHFCIEYFKKNFDLDSDQHLTTEQKAVSKFIQILCEDHLYWAIALHRWKFEKELTISVFNKHFGVPKFLVRMFSGKFIKQAEGQGMGRHTREQVYEFMMDDLQNLSNYLGSKPYLLGDRMCEADCSAFGMLAQCLWIPIKPKDDIMENLLRDKYPNLYQYCHRIKTELWPDWDACLKN